MAASKGRVVVAVVVAVVVVDDGSDQSLPSRNLDGEVMVVVGC